MSCLVKGVKEKKERMGKKKKEWEISIGIRISFSSHFIIYFMCNRIAIAF